MLDLSKQASAQLATQRLRAQVFNTYLPQPSDEIDWLTQVYPHITLLDWSKRHLDLWSWGKRLQKNIKPLAFVGIWPRSSGKSTMAELLTTYFGATKRRSYAWYVSATQDLADIHVENIAALVESSTFGIYYPLMAQRKIGKFGAPRGWRRNRLRCNNGFTVDALGVDVGARGRKVEEQRPDLIILDDIDQQFGAPDKAIKTVVQSILPAGSADVAVLAIQNLVRNDGFFGRIVNGQADYLTARMLSGPWPAIENLQVEQQADGRYVIVGGKPTWLGQSIEVCQQIIDTVGISSFKQELQHEVGDNTGLFQNIKFQHVDAPPDLVRIITVIDPAVTSTDHSDSHGIIIAGIDVDDVIYPLYAFEQVVSPYDSIKLAVQKSIEYGSREIYIETNQGKDLWNTVIENVIRELEQANVAVDSIGFQHISAGSASKIERAQTVLAAYEVGQIVHINGRGELLEAALGRFPITKPYDLVDAFVHAVRILQETAHWLVA